VGGEEFFLTIQAPATRLVAIGAVHIAQALAPIAKLVDFDMIIVDPRTAFATPERFPDVELLAEWPDVALPALRLDRYTAMVLLTHDPRIDDQGLRHALRADCFYIGALGSSKTHAKSWNGCAPKASAKESLRAYVPRSGSTSVRLALRKSPSRSSARSSPPCATNLCAPNRRRLREIRTYFCR